MHELTHASARIIGFTEKSNYSESDFLEHYAIVEYETPQNEEIWAVTQPCNEDMYELNTVVEIICRPDRARSVIILPRASWKSGIIAFEKNFEVGLSLLGIGCFFSVVIWYHGFAVHVLGAILGILGVGFASGYLTKGASKRKERFDASHYQSISNRLVAAQENGSIPASLTE